VRYICYDSLFSELKTWTTSTHILTGNNLDSIQAFLFLSIVLCIEVILRASSFMYNRARKHTTQLREAIQKTKMMMKRIRGGQFPDEKYDIGGDNGEGGNKDTSRNSSERDRIAGSSTEKTREGDEKFTRFSANVDERIKGKQTRRQIAEMKEEDLQIEWERHEAEVHKYLEEREKINDQTSVLVSADANSSRMSFEQFWRESCKFWADIAILFFYAGTANLLLAIMIYMWAEFFITYESPVGAVIAVVFIGVSLVLGILLAIYLRQNDTYGKGPAVRRKLVLDEMEEESPDEAGDCDSTKRPSAVQARDSMDSIYENEESTHSGRANSFRDRVNPQDIPQSQMSGRESQCDDDSLLWSTVTSGLNVHTVTSAAAARRHASASPPPPEDRSFARANAVKDRAHVTSAQSVLDTPPRTPLHPIRKQR
jgi:hypothetical protein